ncbi:ankyrin repeat-containing protein npr4, partial [Fagus crenata]
MNFHQYVPLQKDINQDNWRGVDEFIKENPGAENAKISYSEDKALHTAIFAGSMNIVKELVKPMPGDRLNELDAENYTFLGYCALIGNIEMAKCIIEMNQDGKDGLSIGNGPKNIIPVVVALTYCPEIKMVEYLYSVTPLEQLSPENGSNGATFITRAIYAKAF